MARHDPVPPPADGRLKHLVLNAGAPDEQRVPLSDWLEIGRNGDGRQESSGMLLVDDPTVSRHHCVVTQRPDGRCYVRDTSRNGTRLDGRRLAPNVETEWEPGLTLRVGEIEIALDGGTAKAVDADDTAGGTVLAPGQTIATVLVGDIRDYTVLVRRVPSLELHQSVSRVFELFSLAVQERGGTVKDFQGDAILAYWEGDLGGQQAIAACRAAVAFHRLATELENDPSVWKIRDFPLKMDWALTTGPVMVHSFGKYHPTALSMIGEPVVLAFRLEKFANDETGPILACRMTRDMAASTFAFRDLGEKQAKGFDRPDRVFALELPADP